MSCVFKIYLQVDLESVRAGKLEIERELGSQRSAGRQRLQAVQDELSKLQGQVISRCV